MARLISRDFSPTSPVYVRRFFVAAGRHWNPGDLFNWRQLSVAQRRVKQLYDAGKLMHAAEGGVVEGPGVPLLAGEKPSEQHLQTTPPPSIETEIEDDTILADAAEPVDPVDDLDDLDMKQLRAIAEREGAPSRVSRVAQREAIREHRAASR